MIFPLSREARRAAVSARIIAIAREDICRLWGARRLCPAYRAIIRRAVVTIRRHQGGAA